MNHIGVIFRDPRPLRGHPLAGGGMSLPQIDKSISCGRLNRNCYSELGVVILGG